MNTTTTLFLFGVIVLAGGLLWWVTSDPTTEPNEPTAASESITLNDDAAPADQESAAPTEETVSSEPAATVRYTTGGFSPESITIETGETVQFVNETSNAMWVASNEHPTHTLYSGTSRSEHCATGGSANAFDQCETGNTYSFTFDQPGSWDYHNHVDPSAEATVIVE